VRTIVSEHFLTTFKVHCMRCSAVIKGHETSWEQHMKSNKCRDAPRDKARQGPMLLRSTEAGKPKVDTSLLKKLTSACLLAGGVGYNAQATLFSQGAPELL